jgi:hypothetical protein
MLSPDSIENGMNNNLTQKISFFEYLYLFVLIIYAGRAIKFVEDLSLITNPIGSLIPVILSVILLIRWRIVIQKQFYILIFSFFIYFIIICTKYGDFRITIFLNYFFMFVIVYSVVKVFKYNLFRIYEYLIYFLAIISLLFWSLQIVLGGDTLLSYFGKIPSIIPFSNVTGNGLNVIIYSVQPSSYSLLYQYTIPRNCGYAWEPGAFAIYVCLAIYINLFINRSDKNSKRRLWVLVLTLITTQSTSGYVIFVVIILFYFFAKRLRLLILVFPLLLAALFFLFSLPFMRKKIVEEFNQKNELDIIVANSIRSDVGYAPGRALSFLVAYRNFLDNPLFGVGTHRNEEWTVKLGAKISPVSGIGYLLAQFGLTGFFFLIYLSIKSSIYFSKYFEYNGKILFFLIILLISVSYVLILLPLAMSFWMFTLFENTNPIPEKEANSILSANTESD